MPLVAIIAVKIFSIAQPYFRHSALATSELRKRQEAISITPKKLQQHCSTRWNSTLYMIHSLLHNRWPLNAVLADESLTRGQYRYLELSSQHWLILEDVAKVLKHLKVATVFLSAENNVSISAVLPVVRTWFSYKTGCRRRFCLCETV